MPPNIYSNKKCEYYSGRRINRFVLFMNIREKWQSSPFSFLWKKVEGERDVRSRMKLRREKIVRISKGKNIQLNELLWPFD